jgi:hypothetical protein
MKRDVFSKDEIRYINGFRPAGFLRTWQALYHSKCISGPWIISRSRRIFGALERGNQQPSVGVVRFDAPLLGWHARAPLGFGTISIWGYMRVEKHHGENG